MAWISATLSPHEVTPSSENLLCNSADDLLQPVRKRNVGQRHETGGRSIDSQPCAGGAHATYDFQHGRNLAGHCLSDWFLPYVHAGAVVGGLHICAAQLGSRLWRNCIAESFLVAGIDCAHPLVGSAGYLPGRLHSVADASAHDGWAECCVKSFCFYL